MTLKELGIAYFQYPAIIAYLLLALARSACLLGGRHRWCRRWPRPRLRARLSAGLVRAAPLGAAQPLDVQDRPSWLDLEAHPLRPPPGSQPPRGAVRRAHTTLPTIALATTDRLCDRRLWGRAAMAFRTGLLTTCLTNCPLHPASRLQAQIEMAGGDEEASHGASFPRRDRQFRNYQLLLGQAVRYLLRSPRSGRRRARPCSTSAIRRRRPDLAARRG